jgi:hypothetical protein
MKELKKIAIGGNMRPVHYGFATLSDWCDACGLTMADLAKLGDNMPISTAINMVYCGLKHGARKSKLEFNITFDDVADWLDTDQQALTDAMQIFSDSMSQVSKKNSNIKKVKGGK